MIGLKEAEAPSEESDIIFPFHLPPPPVHVSAHQLQGGLPGHPTCSWGQMHGAQVQHRGTAQPGGSQPRAAGGPYTVKRVTSTSASQTGSYNTLTLTCLKRGLCDPKGHSQPRTNQYGLSKSIAAGWCWDHLGKHLCVLRVNKTIKGSPAGRGIPHPDVPNIPPGSTCRKEFRYVGHGSDNTVQLYSSPTPTNAAALRSTLQQTLC